MLSAPDLAELTALGTVRGYRARTVLVTEGTSPTPST
jgi:hypothetical protein